MDNIKVILFDLDGTLLPMDNEEFTKGYFYFLCKKLSQYGYESKKLVDSIWYGTKAMVMNNGKDTNETVFWKAFQQVMGEDVIKDMPLFDDFYRNDFVEAKVYCGYDEYVPEMIANLKKKYRIALATNPIFPAVATEQRIEWAGLSKADFEIYTTYENIGYSKPNTEYYMELTRRLGVKSEECLMVGNDVDEDMVAEKIGMKTFLVTDNIINKSNKDIEKYNKGTFKDLVKFLEQ